MAYGLKNMKKKLVCLSLDFSTQKLAYKTKQRGPKPKGRLENFFFLMWDGNMTSLLNLGFQIYWLINYISQKADLKPNPKQSGSYEHPYGSTILR